MSSEIEAVIGFNRYIGWSSISVVRSIEELAASFTLETMDVSGELLKRESILLTPCKITIDSETILNGYIDELNFDVDEGKLRAQVSGRCKCGDLIDCSVIHTPASWTGSINVYKLCSELVRPFKLKVYKEAERLGENIINFSIDSGETVFDALKRVCEMRDLLLISNTEGDLVLTNAGKTKAFDALVYGHNILSVSSRFNYTDSFSEVHVKGTCNIEGDAWSRRTVNIYGVAKNESLRYRPKLITVNGYASNSIANAKAAWELQVRTYRAMEIIVRVAGWRQTNGNLWRENQLVMVNIEPFGILQMELLIVKVTYELSDDGAITELVLRRPEVYKPNPAPKIKKPPKVKPAWS